MVSTEPLFWPLLNCHTKLMVRKYQLSWIVKIQLFTRGIVIPCKRCLQSWMSEPSTVVLGPAKTVVHSGSCRYICGPY